MSRLTSFIRRVTAQRDVLNKAAAMVSHLEGPIVEIGLGNGRTYDHLREILPGRRILALDRALNANPASIPPPGDLLLGEIRETGPGLAGFAAVLAHADIETGTPAGDDELGRWLPAVMAAALRPDGVAVSGSPLRHPDLERLPLPEGVPPDRYFFYRRTT